MKHLILILALVAFVTGSYASNVFAATPDVSCVDCLDHEEIRILMTSAMIANVIIVTL